MEENLSLSSSTTSKTLSKLKREPVDLSQTHLYRGLLQELYEKYKRAQETVEDQVSHDRLRWTIELSYLSIYFPT
jgi:hypothetical protein